MSTSSYVLVGKITAPHGIKGHVKLQSYTELPEDILHFPLLYNTDGQHTYRLTKRGNLKGQLIVSLEESTTRNQAEQLRGVLLHAKREEFKLLKNEEVFYVHDLIGCEVIHQEGYAVGRVLDLHDFGGGDIVEIAPPEGASFMVLFTDANFPEVNIEARRVTFSPPEIMKGE